MGSVYPNGRKRNKPKLPFVPLLRGLHRTATSGCSAVSSSVCMRTRLTPVFTGTRHPDPQRVSELIAPSPRSSSLRVILALARHLCQTPLVSKSGAGPSCIALAHRARASAQRQADARLRPDKVRRPKSKAQGAQAFIALRGRIASRYRMRHYGRRPQRSHDVELTCLQKDLVAQSR